MNETDLNNQSLAKMLLSSMTKINEKPYKTGSQGV